MTVRTGKVAAPTQAANDANVNVRPGPPVDSWLRLLAWINDSKVKLNRPERGKQSVQSTALDFVAKVLTDNCGFEDWRGCDFAGEWYELMRHGRKPLTAKSAAETIAEWKRGWEEDPGEEDPYDLRDKLEDYFSRGEDA